MSVALSEGNTRRWRARSEAEFKRLPRSLEESKGGWKGIICMIDTSGSTWELVEGKTVLAWEREAVLSLIAYAKMNGLPFKLGCFSNWARWMKAPERSYLVLGRRFFNLKSGGLTSLSSAVELVKSIRPEKQMIAFITDGEVERNYVKKLSQLSSNNSVVAVVVAEEAHENVLIENADLRKVRIFRAKPSRTGKLFINILSRRFKIDY